MPTAAELKGGVILLKMFRVFFGTARAIRQSRTHAEDLSSLPMEEFVHEWVKILSTAATGTKPKLRPPASTAALDAVEQALGGPLPDEVRAFYATTNGIDWSSADYHTDVVSIEGLVPSSQHKPPLSTQARHSWEENGRDDGEPEGLPVFSTSIVKLLANAHEKVLPFAAIDEMLSLEVPSAGRGAVVVTRPHPSLPPGTVLEIESYSATRHEGIRAWLASTASAIAMINNIAARKSS